MRAINVGVIGETGQLANALKRKIYGCSYNIVNFGRKSLDLNSTEKEILIFVEGLNNIDVLINAAAYTKVDQAENEIVVANRVNGESPGVIAKACAKRDIPMVHVSTDYVFSGQNTEPYQVGNPTGPLNIYGSSKLAGENAILRESSRAVILRTSWVYDGIGKNFFTTMLNTVKMKNKISVVSDQFGRPTYAGHLAEACLRAAKALVEKQDKATGVFHASGNGDVIHWADFAKAIFEISEATRKHTVTINQISSSEYPTKTHRPSYSALDNSYFEDIFGMKLPHWRLGLNEAYAEWVNNQP